ncbi:MAG TPA: amino acid adenylation domain-containing protein, partial [Pyrinomonadaceae bacterium]
DLTLTATEIGDEIKLSIQYRTELFDETTVRRMLNHYRNLLASGVADPEQRISALTLLDEDERRRILVEWNRVAPLASPRKCLHELIADQAARTPSVAAVIYDGGQVTYGELNARSERVAARLAASGVRPESCVGIMLDRSVEMIVALLGVLKAGGAYVPLDPEYPNDRLSTMVHDAGVKTLLTSERWTTKVTTLDVEVIKLDDTEAHPHAPERQSHARVTPENLAYVLYTSGSTGRPKGVAVEHRSVVNYLFWVNEFLFGENVRCVPFLTSLNFDASLKQIFAPLLRGDAIWLPPADVLSRPETLLEPPDARERNLLGLNCVPSLWAMLLDVLQRGNQPPPATEFSLFAGGERLSRELIRSSFKLFPRLKVWNLYGPTEATANACAAQIVNEDHITIGRPILNTRVYVLDARLQPAPLNVPGELYIAGEGLARGYLHHPALTAERFIPDPFSVDDGSRMYRTGDIVRWLAGGELEFIGRADEQMKVRGFRVEPAEIEAVLCEHERVREAIVVAAGSEQLVAYVVCHAWVEDVQPIAELRAHAQARLPSYMVPSAFVLLDSLPLMPNGKIDRQALPDPGPLLTVTDSGFEPPQTSTEEVLARIWTEVLGVERVSVNDNFFDAGGHSLMAMQLIARVRATLGTDIPLQTFFASPTIRNVARAVDEASLASAETATLDEMFAMLESIDDLEAQSLLKRKASGET